MAFDFKKLSDVEVVAEPIESANVLIEENGVIKKVPKTVINSGWDAIIDLGADTVDDSICALWQGNHINAKFISGNYDVIAEKMNNHEMPNVLLYGVADVYDYLHEFIAKANGVIRDNTENNITCSYHVSNLCGYDYTAYITFNPSSAFTESDSF